MTTIKGTLAQLDGWWVFNVYDAESHTLLYTGCERLKTLPTMRDFKRHCLHFNPERVYDIELVATVPTEAEGAAMVDTLKAINPPAYHQPAERISSAVRCVQTGQVYPTAYNAAKSLGLHPANLCNHLNGVRGHRTVRGLTFERVSAISE